jgi:hypothetical protein
MNQVDVLLYLIEKGPGRTEVQLSDALFGGGGEPTRVMQDLRDMAERGWVMQRGRGSEDDPYRYYPTQESPESRNTRS